MGPILRCDRASKSLGTQGCGLVWRRVLGTATVRGGTKETMQTPGGGGGGADAAATSIPNPVKWTFMRRYGVSVAAKFVYSPNTKFLFFSSPR